MEPGRPFFVETSLPLDHSNRQQHPPHNKHQAANGGNGAEDFYAAKREGVEATGKNGGAGQERPAAGGQRSGLEFQCEQADGEKAAVNVGFYYMANAMGRLIGTLLSGLLFQWGGVL